MPPFHYVVCSLKAVNKIGDLFVCLFERYLGGSLSVLPNLLEQSALCHTHGCLDGCDVKALRGHGFVYFTFNACFQ